MEVRNKLFEPHKLEISQAYEEYFCPAKDRAKLVGFDDYLTIAHTTEIKAISQLIHSPLMGVQFPDFAKMSISGVFIVPNRLRNQKPPALDSKELGHHPSEPLSRTLLQFSSLIEEAVALNHKITNLAYTCRTTSEFVTRLVEVEPRLNAIRIMKSIL